MPTARTAPLHDIDLAVPDEALPRVAEYLRPHVVFGPIRYENARLSLLLLTLQMAGHSIDLAGVTHCRIYEEDTQVWVPLPTDLSTFERREIFGLTVPVVPRRVLIDYKTRLDRDVDREDIAALIASDSLRD